MAKKSRNLKAAMQAVNLSLQKFDLPTQALAVSSVAGIYAAGGDSDVRRMAGIGANVDAMIAAFAETIFFNAKKRKRYKSGTIVTPRRKKD